MTRGDSFVIFLMIILLVFVYSKYWQINQENNFAQITLSNTKITNLSLNQDKILKYQGLIGAAVIEIKNKKIRFIHSPCENKYCIHSGWLDKTGAIAVCIPNGISITIKNLNTIFDAINY